MAHKFHVVRDSIQDTDSHDHPEASFEAASGSVSRGFWVLAYLNVFVVSAKVCQTSETQKVYYTLLNIQGRTKVVLNAKNNTKQRKIPKIGSSRNAGAFVKIRELER